MPHSVLGAAFNAPPSSIIGLVDSVTKSVIPLSLASLSPETLIGEGHSYDLLLSRQEEQGENVGANDLPRVSNEEDDEVGYGE